MVEGEAITLSCWIEQNSKNVVRSLMQQGLLQVRGPWTPAVSGGTKGASYGHDTLGS